MPFYLIKPFNNNKNNLFWIWKTKHALTEMILCREIQLGKYFWKETSRFFVVLTQVDDGTMPFPPFFSTIYEFWWQAWLVWRGTKFWVRDIRKTKKLFCLIYIFELLWRKPFCLICIFRKSHKLEICISWNIRTEYFYKIVK